MPRDGDLCEKGEIAILKLAQNYMTCIFAFGESIRQRVWYS